MYDSEVGKVREMEKNCGGIFFNRFHRSLCVGNLLGGYCTKHDTNAIDYNRVISQILQRALTPDELNVPGIRH